MPATDDSRPDPASASDGPRSTLAESRPSARQDLIGGAVTIAFGAFMLAKSLTYPLGSALRMGPGFFPTVLSGLIIVLGMALALHGFKRQPATAMGSIPLRPVIAIAAAIALFGLFIERFGVVPATVALVLTSSLAERRWRPWRVLIIAAGMSVAIYLIFIVILHMPFTLARW